MLKLDKALKAWDMLDFEAVLRDELIEKKALENSMQLGLTYGSTALPENLKFEVLESEETDDSIKVHGGIYYSSLTTGSSCTADPDASSSEMPEYVLVNIVIDRDTADASVKLAPA